MLIVGHWQQISRSENVKRNCCVIWLKICGLTYPKGSLDMHNLYFKQIKLGILRDSSWYICEGPKLATRGGVNGSRSKFLRNLNRRPISLKSPRPSSVLTKIWSSYWKAKPTQKATNERNHEENRKRIGKTAELICLDRSDRCTVPVWPVSAV